MKCPKCGNENRFNAIVCDTCGASLLEASEQEPLDLNRFAPEHSDPVGAPPPAYPDVADPEPYEETGPGFSEKAKETWGKVSTGVSAAAVKSRDYAKKGLDTSSSWLADKLRMIARKFDDGDGVLENDELFRKIALAIILILIVAVIVIPLSFCSSCASCDSCAPDSISGTWVEYSNSLNGYQSTDLILEFTADGQLIDRGAPAGEYTFSEDMLTFTVNGMEYSGITTADAEKMTVSLHGYTSVSLDLVKLSDETGLTAQELAELYPND